MSVWNYCWGHRPPSPRFVVRFVCHFRERENEGHLFCQTRNKNSEIPWENISFSPLFLPLKGAANVRVISPNGLHIPRTHYWKRRSLVSTWKTLIEVLIVCLHWVADFTCWQPINSLTWNKVENISKFWDQRIFFSSRKFFSRKMEKCKGFSKINWKLARTEHFHNNRANLSLPFSNFFRKSFQCKTAIFWSLSPLYQNWYTLETPKNFKLKKHLKIWIVKDFFEVVNIPNWLEIATVPSSTKKYSQKHLKLIAFNWRRCNEEEKH